MQQSKDKVCSTNDEILKLIEESPKVWVSTDWHAVKYDKKTGEISKRAEYDDIKKACSVIGPDDLWIYLGDIIDSEIQRKETLTEVIRFVKTDKRILLLGNNDRFPSYDKWFTYTVNTILLPEKHVVLTHCPIPNDERLNIHGHLHVREYDRPGAYWGMYGIEPGNHVNAFTWPHKPVLLGTLIRKKPNPFVQHFPEMHGKPYTRNLVNNEIRDYKILRAYYDEKNEDGA